VRGVNVFPTQIEELLLRVPALSGHYQIILIREGRLDQIEVQVEARSTSELNEARTHGAADLAHAIKSSIGVSAQVIVLAPAEIERSAGKARRVIDKRPKA
jgi:phenylacetate-CoA ligase